MYPAGIFVFLPAFVTEIAIFSQFYTPLTAKLICEFIMLGSVWKFHITGL
jgi:hypothetical protein